jgi:uncharacterized Rmd1/YagE family protein
MKIEAFQVAEQINLKKFKADFTSSPLFYNNSELFYKQEQDKYFYLFNYGVTVFAGLTDLEKSELLKFIRYYSEDIITGDYKDDLQVQLHSSVPLTINYNSITIATDLLTDDAVRIMMLNIGQSVALDYYEALSFEVLYSTKKFTDELEQKGSLPVSKINLQKFIGKNLNIKHSIIDNLYIFDAPEIVWENEFLEKLDEGLKKIFDLRMRYRDVDYRLKIVQENLALFTNLLQNKESNRLEWVVIVLILIEVLHLIATTIRSFF